MSLGTCDSLFLTALTVMTDNTEDSDFVDEEERNNGAPPPQRATSTRSKKTVKSYTEENVDTFFSDVKGYTDFHRTRKGGDRRPFAAGAKVLNTCVCLC